MSSLPPLRGRRNKFLEKRTRMLDRGALSPSPLAPFTEHIELGCAYPLCSNPAHMSVEPVRGRFVVWCDVHAEYGWRSTSYPEVFKRRKKGDPMSTYQGRRQPNDRRIYEQTVSEQDERIGALANEAARAGDHAQVELCEIALGCGSDAQHTSGTSQADARRECLRVLADAEAGR